MKKGLFFVTLSAFIGIVAAYVFQATPNGIRTTSYQQQPYTFVLDSTNNGFLPSASGSGQSDASNSPRTANNNPIIFSYSSAFKSGSRIRMVKNSGSIANVTPFSGLRDITIVISSGRASLSYGSSYASYANSLEIASGVRYEIDSMPYFKISAGSATPYITSVTVEYLCDATGELDPIASHTHHGYHYAANEPTLEKPGNLEFYTCSECQYVSLTPGDGEYSEAILTYELPSNHIAYLPPNRIRKPTQFDHPIAISLEVPSEGYEVDQTGVNDASVTIQSALNYVNSLGGGTVYIPSGKYLLANQLTVPNRVSLVGDFKGVGAQDYGTVFLCTYTGSGSKLNTSQIIVNTNASINGVTFYYPNQSINSVIEYGPTIYAYSDLTATLSNLFFINAYHGIAVNDVSEGGGELVNIENIYGTFLKNGITAYYQSDVGYWTNINISPSYYANALSEYRCNDATELYKYTARNLIALTLADLDDFSFNKINIDNANTGIYFPIECRRDLQAFWGMLNDVNISDCSAGIYATGIFSGGAAIFTHSQLGRVINVSSKGVLKLSKCSYTELLGSGNTVIESGSENYEAAPEVDDTNTFNIPSKVYYIDDLDITGVSDVSSALQAKIDTFQTGGVIILKNGTYRLDNPITVPNNTMLTSFSNAYTRTTFNEDNNYLVKFISYSSDSCVKLGSFAGINGIHIYNPYKDPDTAYNVLTASGSDSFVAVKGIGDNCFAINTEVSFTFTGFDFTNISGHYVKYCYVCAYDTFIKASGSGKLISSLSNLSFIARNCLKYFAQANVSAIDKYYRFEEESKDTEHDKMREITRTYETMIKLSGGNELVFNCFAYGVKTLIESTNTTLLAVTTSQDNLKDNNYMYIINSGSAKIVNTFRVFGHSFNLVSGQIEIYGRVDFNNKYEKYYNSNTSTDDEPASPLTGLTEDVLSYCESTSGVSGASRNGSYKKQGSYSWRASSTSNPAIAYTYSKDISSYMKQGYIRFYLYCSNISRKGEECTLEITSGGTCDVDEITYQIGDQIKIQGWNEIVVKLSDMSYSLGTFNPKAANYFRFYALNSSGYYYLDYIAFFHKAYNNQILINDCDSLTSTNGVSLSDFRMEGSSSFMSVDPVNAVFACVISSTNISSYMSTGYLSFYFYIPNRDLLGNIVQVELTSSGNCDVSEITYSIHEHLDEHITNDGWNHIQIPLSEFWRGTNNGTFDPTALNFFRLYTLNSQSNFYVDDIRLVK